MRKESKVQNPKSKVPGGNLKAGARFFTIQNSKFKIQNFSAFTLVEVLVTFALLSLIVLALMAVFSGTQRAFQASLTQTDTLESGRMIMSMVADDLRGLTPSYGDSNPANRFTPVNFYAEVTPYTSLPSPLIQSLVGSNTGVQRTNVLEKIFILSHNNQTWTGTGYLVSTNLFDGALYPLYRFYMTTNERFGVVGLSGIFNTYRDAINTNGYINSPNWSHLMDGVVDLTVRAYDTNGIWMTNGYSFGQSCPLKNSRFLTPQYGEVGFVMYSNDLPASVEIELGTLEDRVLKHTESIGNSISQSNYLAQQAGKVHIFRQRVWIRNLDPSAYQ